MTALSLPFEPQTAPPSPPRLWRMVRETSRATYALMKARLPMQERAVYLGLAAFFYRHQVWPTSSELFEFLVALRDRHPQHPRYRYIVDINSVRPRLSMMSTHGRVVVLRGESRPCTSRRSTGRCLHVWRIPQVGDRLQGAN